MNATEGKVNSSACNAILAEIGHEKLHDNPWEPKDYRRCYGLTQRTANTIIGRLVRRHTPRDQSIRGVEMLIDRNVHTHHKRTTLPIRGSRTIIDRLILLAKCEGLRTIELGALLLDTAKSTLASSDVLLGVHFHVVLRRTSESVIHEK